ncbi:MAG: PDGLE domain-containing protein [Candidatus Zipacnadales bacterium]
MRVPGWVWALVGLILGGGLLAPFASSLPDGLESVIEREAIIVEETELPAPLPDYEIPAAKNKRLGNVVASAIGIAVVFVLAFALGHLLSHRRRVIVSHPLQPEKSDCDASAQ